MHGTGQELLLILLGTWTTGFCLARWAAELWPGMGTKGRRRLLKIKQGGPLLPARERGSLGTQRRRPGSLWRTRLEEKLRGAGWKWRGRQYLLVSAAIGTGGLLVGWLFGGSAYWGILFGLGGALGPTIYLEKANRSRREMMSEQLEQALIFLTSGLQAGQSLVQALEVTGREVEEPLAGEMKRVMDEYHVGVSLTVALRRFRNRVSCSEVDYFVEALEIYGIAGGNLGEMLINLADTVRERRLMRSEIRSKTAEGRLAANFVALTPVVLALYLLSAHPVFLEPLLTHPLGRIGLVYGILSWLAGVAVTRRLVNQDALL